MKVTQIKVLAWFVAFTLTLGLCYFVWVFISELPEKQQRPDEGVVREALKPDEAPETRGDERVTYEKVEATFHSFDWSGAPPPPPAEARPVAAGPPKPRYRPVQEILDVLMIKEDAATPEGSSIYIKYKAAANVRNPSPSDEYLLLEERLLAPHDHVRITRISAVEGVTFAFDEEGRDAETLNPREFDASVAIVKVGADGVQMPVAHSIPKAPGQAILAPRKTQPLGPNRFRIGTEDAEYFNVHYLDVLSKDVRTKRYQNPRTGKYEGIEIKSVKAGSMASRHGAQEGDIIKSINGHPVSSVQEAITFAKNNADVYDVWEIEVENKGKIRTVVYETPEE